MANFENELANIHNEVGLVLRQIGRPKESLTSHRAALAVRQRLADANPAVPEFQSNLSKSHNEIGTLLKATGPAGPVSKGAETDKR